MKPTLALSHEITGVVMMLVFVPDGTTTVNTLDNPVTPPLTSKAAIAPYTVIPPGIDPPVEAVDP